MSIILFLAPPLYILESTANKNEPNSKHEVRNLDKDDDEDNEMPEL